MDVSLMPLMWALRLTYRGVFVARCGICGARSSRVRLPSSTGWLWRAVFMLDAFP